MKKFLLPLLLFVLMPTMTGCGLQKIIEQAITNMLPVTVVKGTVILSGQNDHSGTKIKVGNRTTTTGSNGQFQMMVADSPAQSVNTMEIAHVGYVTTNMTVPVENETGEYTINQQLNQSSYNNSDYFNELLKNANQGKTDSN